MCSKCTAIRDFLKTISAPAAHLPDLKRVAFKRDAERHDFDSFSIPLPADPPADPRGVTGLTRDAQTGINLPGIDINRKARSHVEGRIRFTHIHRSLLHDESEHGRRRWYFRHFIDERRVQSH